MLKIAINQKKCVKCLMCTKIAQDNIVDNNGNIEIVLNARDIIDLVAIRNAADVCPAGAFEFSINNEINKTEQ